MAAAVPAFLLRLAPGPDLPSQAVRPVLPPRFGVPGGGSRGEDTGPPASASQAVADAAVTGRSGTSALPWSATPPQRAPLSAAAVDERAAPSGARTVAPSAALATPRLQEEPSAPFTPHQPLQVTSAAPVTATRPRAENAPYPPAPPPLAPAAVPAAAMVTSAPAQPWDASPGAPLHAPLRAATVAQHVALQRQAEAPTVVQVTIDRLEVRAAPAPARDRAAARPRGAGTVPLADYLRQRAQRGQG